MIAIKKEISKGSLRTPGRELPVELLRQRITEKAYELFVRRGRAPGHDVEDWLEAERLVRMVEARESAASASSPAGRSAGRPERKGPLKPHP